MLDIFVKKVITNHTPFFSIVNFKFKADCCFALSGPGRKLCPASAPYVLDSGKSCCPANVSTARGRKRLKYTDTKCHVTKVPCDADPSVLCQSHPEGLSLLRVNE